MTTQAALLGARDSVTPLVVTLASGLLNFVGDVFLVVYRDMGIGGAALATVLAEYAGNHTIYITALQFFLAEVGDANFGLPLLWSRWWVFLVHVAHFSGGDPSKSPQRLQEGLQVADLLHRPPTGSYWPVRHICWAYFLCFTWEDHLL